MRSHLLANLPRRLAAVAAASSAASALTMSFTASSSNAQTANANLTPVRVVTYNILSPELAPPSHFIECQPQHLEPNVRFEKVKHALEPHIADGAIICLQEVSQAWAGLLTPFFEAYEYTLVTGLYGKRFNGYMGVALAWPHSRFKSERVDITRLADTLELPKKEKPPTDLWSSTSRIARSGWCAVRGWFGYVSPREFDPWAEAARRFNIILSTDLICRKSGRHFCVSTYHMPCLFGSDEKVQVMNIHAALAVDHVENFAQGHPYIIAGDFNIQPDSSPYELITKGSLPSGHAQLPPALENLKWNVQPTVALISAYASQDGEPELTNLAVTKFSGNDQFCGTLDYIFLSPGWNVKRVKPLPSKSELGVRSLPSESQPSDHLLIYADLEQPTE